MIKAIIFDCFGVLYLDRAQSLQERYPNNASELRNLNVSADNGFLDRADYILAVSDLVSSTPQEIESFVSLEHSLNRPLLDMIRRDLKPRYKLGVLSNIGRGWMDDFFDVHALHGLFDTVVVSGEEGITKPHPEIYKTVASRLGVAVGECVMIDDLETNCAGADAAGMRSIHFLSNEQLKADLKKLLQSSGV